MSLSTFPYKYTRQIYHHQTKETLLNVKQRRNNIQHETNTRHYNIPNLKLKHDVFLCDGLCLNINCLKKNKRNTTTNCKYCGMQNANTLDNTKVSYLNYVI